MDRDSYALEDIRRFYAKRQFLIGTERSGQISREEYDRLMGRTLGIDKSRAAYLRAFIDGWLYAKR